MPETTDKFVATCVRYDVVDTVAFIFKQGYIKKKLSLELCIELAVIWVLIQQGTDQIS